MTDKIVAFFNTNADLFVLIWAIFFLIHCIKLLSGLAGIRRMRNYRTHRPSEEWKTKLNDLSKRLGIRQSIQLLQSELVKIPVAIGFFKPVILIPLGLLSHLPPDQAETILIHELAHIRRKDYLVNLLQRFAEAIFFFNPALLWISSLIRQEREACCDDIVIANTSNKGNYLEALVSFQEYSLTTSTYAMAISSKRHYLLNRVKRMLTRENKKLNIMEKLLLLTGVTAVTAFTFIPQKDIAFKKQPVVAIIKEPVELKIQPTSASLQVARITPRKPVIKKANKTLVLVKAVKTDTVPAPGKIITHDDISFPSISSTINDDGKTRTETTTATDQNGKKYTITKLNNQVTSLTIDGKNIPENEIKDHDLLFQRIGFAQDENNAWRQKDLEIRKADMAERAKERKIRTEENHKRIELKNKERKKEMKEKSERLGKERKIREKERTKRDKERAIRLKETEGKRKDIDRKEIERRKKIRINRKEEIQQDKKNDNSKEINIQRTQKINTVVTALKKQEIKKNNNYYI